MSNNPIPPDDDRPGPYTCRHCGADRDPAFTEPHADTCPLSPDADDRAAIAGR